MKVLCVHHISNGYAPGGPFTRFLRDTFVTPVIISHPLEGALEIDSSTLYLGNRLKYSHVYRKRPSTLHYLIHCILNFFWIMRAGKFDLAFGLNCLNTVALIFFKFIGRIDVVVHYTVDYADVRYKNPLLNWLYKVMDRISINYADYVLNVSPRICEKRKQAGIPTDKVLLAPNGVHVDWIKPRQRKDDGKIYIIFAGHLVKSKGIDIVIDALTCCENVNMHLHIYGTGPYVSDLELKIEKLGLNERIILKGQVKNQDICAVLSDYDIGIALYTLDDQFNYYCDPVKVKEYFAANCAVLISNVPWIAEYIEEKGLGVKVDNSINSVADALTQLANHVETDKIRNRYQTIDTRQFDWDVLYQSMLNRLNLEF